MAEDIFSFKEKAVFDNDGNLLPSVTFRAVPRIEVDSKRDENYQEALRVIKEPSIRDVLAERDKRYGAFVDHARCSQALTEEFYRTYTANLASNSIHSMTPVMKEALAIIFNKLGRIANGDPSYKDSWVDIAGYATLVADTLKD